MISNLWGSEVIRRSCVSAPITEEPYERIVHVRTCGGRRGKPRLLPGSTFAPPSQSADAFRSASRIPSGLAMARSQGIVCVQFDMR